MLLVAVFLTMAAVTRVEAGGDKVHGDKAQGNPPQYCVEPGNCPWE